MPQAAPPHTGGEANPYTAYRAPATPYGSGALRRGRGRAAAVALSIGLVVLLLAIGGVAVWMLAPRSVPVTAPTSAPHSSAAPTNPPSGRTTPDSADPGSGSPSSAAQVKATLDGMIAGYRQSAKDGSLWQQIPDSERNRTALQAFLYVLTDMRAAFVWGVDDGVAAGYLADAKEYERKLLAQQPLGTSVKITSNGKTFSYNGETGDGGWS
ncbi:MAG: hypothetical protein JST33_14840 [Actinobacteria bacterium]|nr:hypothetical protein [Actinomycetota bacterium]